MNTSLYRSSLKFLFFSSIVFQPILYIAAAPNNTPAEIQAALEEAARNIKRENPADVKNLPEEIKIYLSQNALTLPVASEGYFGENIIQGEFFNKGQKDWAVLASKDFVSSIYIFPNGRTESVTVMETQPDWNHIGRLMTKDKTTYFYNRALNTLSRKEARRELRKWWGTKPPLKNEAIYLHKELCAEMHFFHEGRWQKEEHCGE